MSKGFLQGVAALWLALSSTAFADDAPPTLGERVGYALSLAGNAAHGDKKSLAELQDAAAQDPAADFGLGEYYFFVKDYPQSVTWLKRSADQGFPGGYYGLGKAYEFGYGVHRDYAQAMRLYLQATAIPEAETRIGDLYAYGQGVPKDDAQAESWYRKAAQSGSIEAQVLLGFRYEQGVTVKQDLAQALQWYRKAADVGDPTAEYLVGKIYERAGALQDYKQAATWYQRASQQGVADAQLALGLLYASGEGIPADANKAVQQFQMAANQGQSRAQCQLAQSFAEGRGVPVDPVRAYQWFALTQMSPFNQKDQGCEMAPEKLSQLARQLGAAQTARARQAAETWRDSYEARPAKADDLPPF